jgi:hypothetical protein
MILSQRAHRNWNLKIFPRGMYELGIVLYNRSTATAGRPVPENIESAVNLDPLVLLLPVFGVLFGFLLVLCCLRFLSTMNKSESLHRIGYSVCG